jgi:hypothetical protein
MGKLYRENYIILESSLPISILCSYAQFLTRVFIALLRYFSSARISIFYCRSNRGTLPCCPTAPQSPVLVHSEPCRNCLNSNCALFHSLQPTDLVGIYLCAKSGQRENCGLRFGPDANAKGPDVRPLLCQLGIIFHLSTRTLCPVSRAKLCYLQEGTYYQLNPNSM